MSKFQFGFKNSERGPVFCPAGGIKTNFLGNMGERAGEQAQLHQGVQTEKLDADFCMSQ